MSKTILITGGTGLIGSRITDLLKEKGHNVRYLSRSPESSDVEAYKWDIRNQEIDMKAFEGVDAIIHLAGAGVADKKWTKERKKVILESRTQSTQLLKDALSKLEKRPSVLVSASAIGYYGYDTGGVWKKEDSRFGDDFLATVTKSWEASVDEIDQAFEDVRTVKIRIGIVFSEQGGALKEIAKPVKLWVGAPLASGNQYMSWIHIDDLSNMFVAGVENEAMQGVYNGVAPNPETNKQITKWIGKALKKPLWLPNVPAFVMKLMLGEMASMVIGGSKVSSEKIQETGFVFRFENAKEAIDDLLG